MQTVEDKMEEFEAAGAHALAHAIEEAESKGGYLDYEQGAFVAARAAVEAAFDFMLARAGDPGNK